MSSTRESPEVKHVVQVGQSKVRSGHTAFDRVCHEKFPTLSRTHKHMAKTKKGGKRVVFSNLYTDTVKLDGAEIFNRT